MKGGFTIVIWAWVAGIGLIMITAGAFLKLL